MKKSASVWVVAALVAAVTSALGQESKDPKPVLEAAAAKPPGPRLRVQFVATRQHGDQTIATRPYGLVFHPDDKPAKLFVGTEVPLTGIDKGEPTLIFKNVGIELQASAQALPDGRYSLDARFEEGSLLRTTGTATTSSIGDNPILQFMRSASKLTIREGETVPFAALVDPVTGDRVRVDVTLVAPSTTKAAVTTTSGDPRIRVQLVLTRRKGETKTVSRTYSVVMEAGDKTSAGLFSGSQLPLPFPYEGRTTIGLKDVGAGAHLTAERLADGRYRLDLHFSDGSLAEVTGNRPSLHMVTCDSALLVRSGETVPLASGVDPQTGDVVEVEVTVDVVR
jgi:Flp pilus assembly secretin CpaC